MNSYNFNKTLIKYSTFFIFCIFILNNSLYSNNIENEVSQVSSQLMCPVCQGQTVSESNSDLAIDMRLIIKRKLEEGQSREEILSYFVERYGDTVLASPPVKGINWILWASPLIALFVGVIFIHFYLSRTKEMPRDQASSRKNNTNKDSDIEYKKIIEKELKNLD